MPGSRPTIRSIVTAPITRAQRIARAETAIEEMKEEFSGWIQEETEDLLAAQTEWMSAPEDDAARSVFFRRAHDLKGQATTLGYPLVSRIASSLCDLLAEESVEYDECSTLTAQHVAAIKAAVRADIRDTANSTAASLATELEAAVRRLVPDPN